MTAITAEIKKSIVETEEDPFIPGDLSLRFTLIPIEEDEPYVPPEVPGFEPRPYVPPELPKLVPKFVPAVIDIETTGVMPFDSQLICISVIDLRDPDRVITFADLDERKVITDFILWFNQSGINQLIGYNLSFDHRFIFVKAMWYRMQTRQLHDVDMLDMMNVMKQVKLEFVFGFNKPGSLSQWSEYFFNMPKLLSLDKQLELWERKEIQPIIESNQNDTRITLMLYWLYLYTKGDLHA